MSRIISRRRRMDGLRKKRASERFRQKFDLFVNLKNEIELKKD
jgi:hypothetical protein